MLERWHPECDPRLPSGCEARVVISSGVNDPTIEDGRPPIAPDSSAANLQALLRQLATKGPPVLFVGPPPVDHEEQNERIGELNVIFAAICAERAVPYASVFPELSNHATWRQHVREGDGSHHGEEGYDALANLLIPIRRSWLTSVEFHGR